jgi:alcohol dehydrogenase (cytochrome c)
VVTATPVVANGVVFVQDMKSNVYALDARNGRLRWRHNIGYPNPGPNGVAVDGGRVFGATDTTAFALAAGTGRRLWSRLLLTTPAEHFVDTAPQVDNGTVFMSSVGYPPGGRGALYALDAATGVIRWRFGTIKEPWRFPREAGGGGAWYPPSVDAGEAFFGTSNPAPWGGTRKRPNGGSFPGPALYTDSLVVLDTHSGKLRWYDQVTPHDIRDHDFQLSPVLGSAGRTPAIFGAGKAGVVIAWSRKSRARLWQTTVGLHRNDRGPLPRQLVSVCPGLLGGVETPMALGEGKLFVPVVNLCMRGSAYGYEPLGKTDVSRGTSALVALDAKTGRRVWTHSLPQPDFGCATLADGVVLTSTFDGTIYALDTRDGAILWKGSARAGINACPSLVDDKLLVAAGIVGKNGQVAEIIAFGP